jgi:hypothetical protein
LSQASQGREDSGSQQRGCKDWELLSKIFHPGKSIATLLQLCC